jgi:hypothetical protein
MKKFFIKSALLLSFIYGNYTMAQQNRATQAEQVIRVYFNQTVFINELKDEFHITDEKFHQYEPALMKAIFKNKISFIKGFISGEQNLQSAETYFTNFKKDIKEKAKQILFSNSLAVTPDLNLNVSESQWKVPGGPCVNPDFETCNFSSWDLVYRYC